MLASRPLSCIHHLILRQETRRFMRQNRTGAERTDAVSFTLSYKAMCEKCIIIAQCLTHCTSYKKKYMQNSGLCRKTPSDRRALIPISPVKCKIHTCIILYIFGIVKSCFGNFSKNGDRNHPAELWLAFYTDFDKSMPSFYVYIANMSFLCYNKAIRQW